MTEKPAVPSSIRRATEPVFHYTTARGFLGAIQGRRVWASQASGLNDRAEVRLGWEKVRAWLHQQPNSQAIELLRDMARVQVMSSHEVFVLSGSTTGDDANQWRLYGAGGTGYVMEFDPAVDLVAVSTVRNKPTAKLSANSTWSQLADVVTVSPWLHVLYRDDELEAGLAEHVRSVGSDIRRLSATALPSDEADVQYQELQGDAYAGLAQIAHLVKAPGFSGENEVRIVTTYLWSDKHVQYREGAYGIVAYGELTTRPDRHISYHVYSHPPEAPPPAQLPVTSVRLGPLLPDEHQETVKAFLKRNALKGSDVSVSKVPLR